MIPLSLEIAHFMSYRDKATLNFEGIHVATISGMNGAGKSTILDAMTWALFGKSRTKLDDDVVNRLSAIKDDAAEVTFTFDLEGSIYRVIRRKRLGKNIFLELQIQGEDGWKALTENKVRESEEVIRSLLRMNFDTFTNASFLLQGKADAFTTATPATRKQMLSELLGINVWNERKDRATARRKQEDNNLTLLDARLGDIQSELELEAERKEKLAAEQAELAKIEENLGQQQTVLEALRKSVSLFTQQQKHVKSLADTIARESQRLAQIEQRKATQQQKLAQHNALLSQKAQIVQRFDAWQSADKSTKEMQTKADQFNAIEQQKRPHEVAIAQEKTRLEQRLRQLHDQKQAVDNQQATKAQLEQTSKLAEETLKSVAEKLVKASEARELVATANGEKTQLAASQTDMKAKAEKQKKRIETLEADSGADCPVCGQAMTDAHKSAVISDLNNELDEMRTAYKVATKRLKTLATKIEQSKQLAKSASQLDREQATAQRQLAEAESKLKNIDEVAKVWAESGKGELAKLTEEVQLGKFAPEARQALAELQKSADKLAYDAEAHSKIKADLANLADAQSKHLALDKAETAVSAANEAIAEFDTQRKEATDALTTQRQQHAEAVTALTDVNSSPDELNVMEKQVNLLREEKTAVVRRVGMAEQNLAVLDKNRAEIKKSKKEREQITQKIQRLKLLEKAFGRDGVQALLIDQALPDIEARANEILDRLSDGQMRITLSTQGTKKSGELKETLDIRISDGLGERPYENFSGGEQFRVNFALRLALSRVLSQRVGARLQTLVIDEGFGSQDPEGRQRLIEAINRVQNDFERVLVITHIDELKDAFPTRIEVNKTPTGSQIVVG